MKSTLAGTVLLVVEDDRDTRELFSRLLREHGADVRAAETAEAALAVLADARVDAVLCDLHLPDVDGYALRERARALPDASSIAWIAISASHPELEQQRALAAGFVEHLVKPSRVQVVIDAIANALRK